MKIQLIDVVNRNMRLKPWAEGEKIPWNDPAFSRRMLREHLSQKHDAASRRTSIIQKQVKWIHNFVLDGYPSQILDLGCGPGLYAARLEKLGHTIRGIDFSPASIRYARAHAPSRNSSFILGDIRTAEFGSGYDLVMLIYGEFNVFRPVHSRRILQKAFNALKPGGKLLLEIQTFESVEQLGNQPSTWYSSQMGLFADSPHLCLMDSFWDEKKCVASERYFIVDASTGNVTRYASATQAYHEKQIITILRQIGFRKVATFPSLIGKESFDADDFQVILATK